MPNRLRPYASSTVGTLLGSAPGALLPFVVTATLAAGSRSDEFFLALSVTTFVTIVVGLAIEGAGFPLVVRAGRSGRESVNQLLQQLRTQGAVASAALTLPLFALLVAADRLRPSTAVALAPAAIFASSGAASASALALFNRFGLASLTLALRTAPPLLLVAVAGFAEPWLLGGAFCAGEAVRAVVLWSAERRAVRTVPSGPYVHTTVRQVWAAAAPQVASTGISGVSPLLNKSIAVGISTGGATLLELAEKVIYAPTLLVSTALGRVFGARWAAQAVDGDDALQTQFWRVALRASGVAGALAVMSIVLVSRWAGPVTRALGFDDTSAVVLTYALYAMALPLVIFGILAARLLTAVERTDALPGIAAVGVATNGCLALLAAYRGSVVGLAASHAGMRLVTAVMYARRARGALADRVPPEADAPGLFVAAT